jgi:hypothetical protein
MPIGARTGQRLELHSAPKLCSVTFDRVRADRFAGPHARPESRRCPALYSAQETLVARAAPRDRRDRPGRAAPAAAERIVPANTDQAPAPGGAAAPPAGGHVEDAPPWRGLAVDELLRWMGTAVPRLLAALYAALARLLGG